MVEIVEPFTEFPTTARTTYLAVVENMEKGIEWAIQMMDTGYYVRHHTSNSYIISDIYGTKIVILSEEYQRCWAIIPKTNQSVNERNLWLEWLLCNNDSQRVNYANKYFRGIFTLNDILGKIGYPPFNRTTYYHLKEHQADIIIKFLRPEWEFNPNWITETTKSLAISINDEKRNDLSPILADALEDSGCDNQELLSYLRDSDELIKGDWVIEHLLGKR